MKGGKRLNLNDSVFIPIRNTIVNVKFIGCDYIDELNCIPCGSDFAHQVFA